MFKSQRPDSTRQDRTPICHWLFEVNDKWSDALTGVSMNAEYEKMKKKCFSPNFNMSVLVMKRENPKNENPTERKKKICC